MYRVLLVEDNAAQRFLAAHLTAWASCGFCVAAMAADGKDAMELLGRESFDLVLTDIRMPVMDGLALLRAVHALGAKAPAVVLASSYSDFSYAREGLQHGALDYLVKPYTEQSVRETLQRILPRLEELTNSHSTGLAAYRALLDGAQPDGLALRACDWAARHLDATAPLQNAAAQLGVTPDYLSKLFRKSTGCSYPDFCARLKLEEAKRLLREGFCKTYEISAQLGYRSVDYFTRKFKAATGMTPGEYRKSAASLQSGSEK